MRTWLPITNTLVAVLFTCFFAYTLVGRRHVDHLAREFVAKKTQAYADPIVAAAEEGLKGRIARTVLKDDQIAALDQEITQYRNDPPRYISKLTSEDMPVAVKRGWRPPLKLIQLM